MHFMVLCLLRLCYANDVHAWRPVYLEDGTFITEDIVPSKSDMECAIKSSRYKWPYIFKFENNMCEMSSQKYVPSESIEGLMSPKVCMTRLSPQGMHYIFHNRSL